MISDEQRGRYGRWLRKGRLSLGLSTEQVRARLAAAGYRAGESAYAEWESGRRRPSRDALPYLAALFGPIPDEPTPDEQRGGALTTDLAPLLEAMAAQTEAIRELAEAIRDNRPPWWAQTLLSEVIALRAGVAAPAPDGSGDATSSAANHRPSGEP